MVKHVYLVTHGRKYSGANPGMTEDGFRQVSSLRDLLPKSIPLVVCGTGRRHLDVSKALGLEPQRYTSVVGGPDSGESSTGSGPVDVVILSDGTSVPYEQYTTLVDTSIAFFSLLGKLPADTLICAGRPSMIMLGMEEAKAKSAAVYRLTVKYEMLESIEEIIAFGPAEIRTV